MSSSTAKTPVARFLILLLNFLFFAAGIFVIVYAVMLNKSGWLDCFDEEYPWIRSTLVGCLIALGCVVILISLMGCAGAGLKKKGLLRCYNAFVVIGFILFFVVMAGAFASMFIANSWSTSSYPAAQQEPTVARGFNQVYCYAEAAYLCTAAPIAEAVAVLIPGLPDSVTSLVEGNGGINALCTSETRNLIDSLIPDGSALEEAIATACEECSQVSKYEQYEGLYTWIDSQCPLLELGSDAIAWCGDFILEGVEGGAYKGAPYGACRPQFLQLWSSTSMVVGIVLVSFLLLLVVLIISTCTMTRRRSAVQQERSSEVVDKNSKPTDEEQPHLYSPGQGGNVGARVY